MKSKNNLDYPLPEPEKIEINPQSDEESPEYLCEKQVTLKRGSRRSIAQPMPRTLSHH